MSNPLYRSPYGLQLIFPDNFYKRTRKGSLRSNNDTIVSRDWIDGWRPGDPAQTNGTCVARGAVNVAEILLMSYNPCALLSGEHLDGDELYIWIRNRYYNDQDMDAGAVLEDGAKALIETGILPPDSRPEQLDVDPLVIMNAYKKGPILQGHIIDTAWNNTVDGRIPDFGPRNKLGGHCTIGLGQWFFEDREAEYIGGNSWGDTWGNHGRFTMGWNKFQETCVDLWRIDVNPSSMATWSGHRKFIKRVA